MTELSENWILFDKTYVNQRPLVKLLKRSGGDLDSYLYEGLMHTSLT